MSAGQAELLSAVSALKDHIDGTNPLNPSQIEDHKLTIDSNKAIFGDVAAKKVKLAVTSGYRDDYWELAEFVAYGIVIE